MALSKHFRWILVTNLLIRNEKTIPPHIEPFSFAEVEDIIRQKYEAQATHYPFQGDRKIMRIRDIGPENEDYLSVLIGISDKNVPDFAYEHFPTGDIRNIEKDEDEGLLNAAHLVIRKEPIENGQVMLIEKVPGIHASSLSNYLRYLFNDPEVMKSYNEEGATKSYRPIFEITGHMSHTLRDALQRGKLQDIEFVSNRIMQDGHDEYDYVQEQIQTAKFIVKRGITTDTADGFFSDIVNRFREEDYEKMFVRIKTNKGQIKQTEVDTSQEDILSQYFFQNETISDFETPIERTHQEINDEVVSKMITKMGNYI